MDVAPDTGRRIAFSINRKSGKLSGEGLRSQSNASSRQVLQSCCDSRLIEDVVTWFLELIGFLLCDPRFDETESLSDGWGL